MKVPNKSINQTNKQTVLFKFKTFPFTDHHPTPNILISQKKLDHRNFSSNSKCLEQGHVTLDAEDVTLNHAIPPKSF